MWHLGGSSRMSSFADDGAWQAFPCCRFAFRFVSLDERCRFCHVSVYSAVCVGQMRSLKLYSSPQCALALGSRSRVALRICADCVLTGLLMSVLLQVTSLIVLFWRFGTIPMWEALRPVDLVLQGVVLANAGMVSFLAMLAFHSSAFSCLTGILYGMWDFMAMNVVGGGLPPIGWSLAIVPDGAGWAAIVVQAGVLVSLSLVLGVLLWLAAGKVDYLDCGRGLSKA